MKERNVWYFVTIVNNVSQVAASGLPDRFRETPLVMQLDRRKSL